ncbi:hypothetical protein CRG98_048107 [Punica granatum]|uniref:Secreted protein n=1 Tax=Punica granatum TaxID=22663 RepID=A0A2I0HIG4_PUNGR|nr:hypothetical protein CRG98_048107 [Punica granatum]
MICYGSLLALMLRITAVGPSHCNYVSAGGVSKSRCFIATELGPMALHARLEAQICDGAPLRRGSMVLLHSTGCGASLPWSSHSMVLLNPGLVGGSAYLDVHDRLYSELVAVSIVPALKFDTETAFEGILEVTVTLLLLFVFGCAKRCPLMK